MSTLGAQWERELADSIAAYAPAWGHGLSLTLNDRRSRRPCDLMLPLDAGQTLWIEAKATAQRRWSLRQLRPDQREHLQYLHDQGHVAGVALLYRTPPPGALNSAWWLPWSVLAELDWTHIAQDECRYGGLPGVAEMARTVVQGRAVWNLLAIPEVGRTVLSRARDGASA